MAELTGWQAVAMEFDCRRILIGVGPEYQDWLPAEAAAKEILRLREQLAQWKEAAQHVDFLRGHEGYCGNVVLVTVQIRKDRARAWNMAYEALTAPAKPAAEQQQEAADG